jgi:UDP-N-acetylglucosamine/UDP-N-acetylgalactosamine diphosphorylase
MLNNDLTQKKQFLHQQRAMIAQKANFPIPEPFREFDSPTQTARLKGEELLSEGKIACLVLAGGQGTRLGTSLPKALVEVTSVRKKTLLQLFCEKTAAASIAYQTPLQMAIMTSSLNHTVIADYLLENGYFGLASSQVHLFMQDNAPFLDDQGNWFLESTGCIAAGPDGNGHSLRKLMESGIGKQWKEQGIESLIVLPIDNPLADPFDASLCGEHALKNREATLKAIERHDPHEKVGVIVSREGRIAVQEYSELPDHFEAPLAHIGLFCFSLSFIERIAQIKLPWHLARKKYGDQKIWKFERFLFDVLSHTQKAGVLVYPREDVYAPLKNLEGPHCLETVQQALSAFDRRLIADLTKMPEPGHLFELDPAFYYVTINHRKKWSGKTLPVLDYYVVTNF